MRGPEGGFYSALDADSEGEEGRFYTWTPAEAHAALDDAGLDHTATAVLTYLGITPQGQLEGRSVLHLPTGMSGPAPAGYEEARQALLAARESRVRPGLDDKRLLSWNALMIGALAEAGSALGEPAYVEAATGCADFLLTAMRDDRGRLLRTFNDGRARLNAYLEDYAYLLEGLLDLYEATFDARHYAAAREIADAMVEHFADPVNGGFFTTSDDHEELIARRKDLDDHPAPSGNSSAARGLLRLAAMSGDASYESQAVGVLKLLAGPARKHPQAFAYMLGALDFHVSPTREVALVSPAGEPDATGPMVELVRSRYRPDTVVAAGAEGATSPELLADRPALAGEAAAYVCERFTCKAPVGTVAELDSLLAADAAG